MEGCDLKWIFEIATSWIHIPTRIKAWGLLAEAGQAHRKLHILLTCHLLGLHNGLDVGLGTLDIDLLLTILYHPILEVRIAPQSLNG